MKKSLPKMTSDKAVKKLLREDLSPYIYKENFIKMDFEFAPKNKSITLRMSQELLMLLKAKAKKAGFSYQKMIRQAIQRFLLA